MALTAGVDICATLRWTYNTMRQRTGSIAVAAAKINSGEAGCNYCRMAERNLLRQDAVIIPITRIMQAILKTA